MNTQTPTPLIPPMPDSGPEMWQELWRSIYQLQMDNEMLHLELALMQTRHIRQKFAWDYAEEAVAKVYNWHKLDFFGNRKVGRPVSGTPDMINEPRFLLYTILFNVFGIKIHQLEESYRSTVRNHVLRWRPIFDIIHNPGPLKSDAEREIFDRYAPKFRQAYALMREEMISDGVWHDAYNLTSQPLERA